MKSSDAIAGIVLGIFLIAVVVQRNTKYLLSTAKRDTEFLKWGLAVVLLVFIRDNVDQGKGVVTFLIAATFLALFLNSGKDVAKNAQAFWISLQGKA